MHDMDGTAAMGGIATWNRYGLSGAYLMDMPRSHHDPNNPPRSTGPSRDRNHFFARIGKGNSAGTQHGNRDQDHTSSL